MKAQLVSTPHIYSLSQLLLELWVMVLCVLAMTVIAVPLMGLWNVSLTWLSSMAYVFSVLCVRVYLKHLGNLNFFGQSILGFN